MRIYLISKKLHIKDIRDKKIVEFPSAQKNTEENNSSSNEPAVHIMDDHTTDSNSVVVNKLLKEETTTEVSIHVEDTPKSHWKYVGQGIPRVYMPPELDADTGMKIESIHEATKEPRQFIIKNAVELLYNKVNSVPPDIEKLPKPAPFQRVDVIVKDIDKPASTIPDEALCALFEAGIHLNLGVAERLWLKYPESFLDAIAYTIQESVAGKIKQSKEGFFRKSLEEGWSFTFSPKQTQLGKKTRPLPLTLEQEAWYKWACDTKVCDGRPIGELLPTWNGEVGVFVFIPAANPILSPWVMKPISIAMREFPIQ